MGSDEKAPAHAGPLRVLIVEDDAAVSSALGAAMTEWGAQVVLANSIQRSLLELATAPDLIVLDVHLPDGSGVTLAEQAGRRRPMPLMLAISGRATAQEAFRLAELGVRGYLPKPLSLVDFTATIEALLDRAPDFVPQLLSSVGREPFRDVLERVRRAMTEQALALAGGNRSGAARLLGVTRQAVQQLIRELDIDELEH